MDWKGAMEREMATLMRVVALIHALAGLAEAAADRSAAVRAFVLWIVGRAETIARDFIEDEPEAPMAGEPAAPSPRSAADAFRLAANLRALATLLETQIAWMNAVAQHDWDRVRMRSAQLASALAAIVAPGLMALTPNATLTILSLPLPDTS